MNNKIIIVLFMVFIYIAPFTLCNCMPNDSIQIKFNNANSETMSTAATLSMNIVNRSKDTLIFITSVFFEGPAGKNIVLGSYYENYAPNLIVIYSKETQQEFGKGVFVVNYDSFPALLVIPPKINKTLVVDLSKIKKYLGSTSYITEAIFRFAVKAKFDNLVQFNYSNRISEYQNALLQSDTVECKTDLSEQIKSQNESGKIGLLNEILKVFDIEERASN